MKCIHEEGCTLPCGDLCLAARMTEPGPPEDDRLAQQLNETMIVQARIPVEIGQWVSEEFPHGFKQVFINQCFLSLRHVMLEGELPPPSDYARLASIAALTELSK